MTLPAAGAGTEKSPRTPLASGIGAPRGRLAISLGASCCAAATVRQRLAGAQPRQHRIGGGGSGLGGAVGADRGDHLVADLRQRLRTRRVVLR